MTQRISIMASAALCVVTVIACSKKDQPQKPGTEQTAAFSAPKVESVAINGAGATFPFPLYSKWMADYNQRRPDVKINYQSIGSGGGIRQITAGTVDFGATDAPMTEDEVKKAPRKIIHIPTTLGSVVITYNLENISRPLKITPETLSSIYMGKVKKWNDAMIAKENVGVKLPTQDISVVYRSDGSGTTAVFTDYLAKVSSEFKEKVGQGKSVKWPVGLGAKGNEGVTGQVKTSPGTIGYVEYVYAIQNHMPMAELRNAAGSFVAPSIAATTAAAAGVELPNELYASVTNAAGSDAYPISAYTYMLVYEDLGDQAKGTALADFLWWAIHDGQTRCEPLGYAKLPAKVVTQVETRLRTLRVGNKPALAER